MEDFKSRGLKIRELSKELVMDFMQSSFECCKDGIGMTQTKIFNECGFGWENYPIATLTRQ